MSTPLRRIMLSLQIVMAAAALTGLGACGRDDHVTRSLTGIGRGTNPFQEGSNNLPQVAKMAFNPSTVQGGRTSTATITLSSISPAGGSVVALRSSNTARATVPASATVPAGATTTTFIVTVASSTVTTNVNITAALNGNSRTETLGISPGAAPPPPPPPPPAPDSTVTLTSVSLDPASLTAGLSSVGTVVLSAAAPAGGAVVALSSSDAARATVPASATVPAGATSTTFPVTTSVSPQSASVVITATFAGVSQTATLAIAPTDPCAGLTGLSGAVVTADAEVPQFRANRLRIEIVGDVPAAWINALGACVATDTPAVSFVSGTGNVTFSGSGSSATATGSPLTFGPLLFPGALLEPGVVVAEDAAGNVLEIIWPGLAGDVAGPPILRLQLAAWNPAVAAGTQLDVSMVFNARHANGTTATFTASASNLVVPPLR